MAKVTKRMFEEEENTNQAIRINKYLSDSGVCSRREADLHVEKGDVTIDGEVAVMGSKVLPHQTVTFCRKEIVRDDKMILIALNKPQGIVCTTDLREPDNIIDFLKYGKRIYPIGRLDKDSEGLILLTNNGDIVNKILRAGNHHEKEYIVTVNKAMTATFLKGMSNGVPILDTVTRPCTIEAMDRTTFRIILTQGLNRQIRRMCEYFGYKVTSLQRVRIMNIRLGHLQLGGYRNLADYELEGLKELIQDSYSHPISDEVDEEMMDVRVLDKNIYKKNTKAAGYKKKQYKGKNFIAAKDNFKDKASKPSKDNFRDKTGKTSKPYKDSFGDKTGKPGKDNFGDKTGKPYKDSFRDKPGKPGKDSFGDKTSKPSKDSFIDKTGKPGNDSFRDKTGKPYNDRYQDKRNNPSQDSDRYKGNRKTYMTSNDTVKAASKLTTKAAPKYISKDAPKYDSRDTSKYTSKDTSKHVAKDTSKYATKDTSKYASKDTSKYAAKDKGQDQRSVGQGKKEYGNAGQKTKNYRTNRTSR